MGRAQMSAPRRSRLSAAVSIALLFTAASVAPTAQAQQDGAVALDRIEVTGSRIKRSEIENQVPVQVISREDIERTGLTSVGDIIQQITASGSALNTKFNSSGNFGFPPDGSGVGAGSTTVDLRHLGPKRVLVLVDGLRWVNESSASGVGSATDLNTIPVAIIERIEVLEDGASALYGSDAIAGVVNIITRRNFDGAQVAVYYGQNEEGDGETTQVDVSFGGTGERFDFFIGASYVEQQEIFSRDREQSSFPVPGTGVTFGSSATPTGRFIFIDPNTGAVLNLTPNTGVPNPVYDGTPGCARTDDFHCFTTADRFNFSQFNLLLTPSERRGLFAQTHYEVTDSVTWYFRGLYNQRESLNQAAPEPFFLGAAAGTGNPFADNIVISATNPFNPFGFDLDSSENLILVGRRPIEGGPRRFFQDVDTWYLATGLEGAFEVGDRSWFWDVNFVASQNEAQQTNFGSYNIRRIAQALGPIDACNADPQCVPLNIFGNDTITPEMLAYIQPVVRDESQNELTLWSANLSGDLFDMPAGPLAFAAGFEHRDLEGFYRPDSLTVAGEYNGVPSSPTQGEYDVDEFYAEFSVPVYSAGDSRLDLSIAGRYSDYSTFGGESTGKFGLRWQVTDDFLLRGTFAEGFRAPSIGELFGSISRFDGTISDPCLIGLDGSPPSAPQSNCQALGVAPGTPELTQQYSVLTGGNPNLDPETADSYTVGAVWSPEFMANTAWSERMDFEITYYNHEVEGAVQAFDAQTAVDLCAQTLDPAVCALVNRGIQGYISSISAQLENLGVIETDGFDVDWFWTFPDSDWGQFKLAWQNTFVNDYEAVSAGGVVQPQAPGREVNNSSIPEWTSYLRLSWASGPWNATYALRHISDLTEDCGNAASFPVCSDPASGSNSLGSTTYHDVQVGWTLDWLDGTQLSLGVNNLLDKDPPICLSCSLNGYDASTYDLPGRFWYVRAEVKF
ncbi:MAG TPA: TonB-dependent receptor [Xanthomonadaceae bacterium]|nr:TonB-dependent receptor [Xanthomonadaceae bacterium]